MQAARVTGWKKAKGLLAKVGMVLAAASRLAKPLNAGSAAAAVTAAGLFALAGSVRPGKASRGITKLMLPAAIMVFSAAVCWAVRATADGSASGVRPVDEGSVLSSACCSEPGEDGGCGGVAADLLLQPVAEEVVDMVVTEARAVSGVMLVATEAAAVTAGGRPMALLVVVGLLLLVIIWGGEREGKTK